MNNRIKYRLKQSESKKDINEDSFTQVGFIGENRLLPVGEINHIVDVGEEFNKERNSSFIYRIKGTVCPLFSNPLMNPESKGNRPGVNNNKNGYGHDVFNDVLFKSDPRFKGSDFGAPDLNFKESYNEYLTELDGWFGFYDPDITKAGFCEYYDIEPTRDKFDLNSYTNKNWEINITYPYDSDTGHTVVDGGLLVIDAITVNVGGKNMLAMATSTYHGLETGDRVRLSNMPSTTYNGDFTVKRLGLDDGTYMDNYFVIDLESTGSAFSTGRMKKVFGGQESVYYLRKFKTLINVGDYEMYPLAFSKTLFNDQNYQFIINQDVDVEGLTDNLGRPISELYLTFIKTDSRNMFGPIKSGLDLEFLGGNIGGSNASDPKRNISNVRQIHDGLSTPFYSHNPLPNESNIYVDYMRPVGSGNKDWFYGDVVEYNKYTLKETVLADVLHRFNTVQREGATSFGSLANGPRREGYLYKPHHLYKIREFSSYIEQGDSTTADVPYYREDLGDGRLLWRDLLDIGVYEGTTNLLDYPFTNGAHYLHQNICFKTIRQDPFGVYNLYYEGNPNGEDRSIPGGTFDPADPRGDALNAADNFKVKSSENVC